MKIGSLPIGGGAPVSVQTMLNDDPHDAVKLLAHLRSCETAGADIVRLTVPDAEAARVLGKVRRQCEVPLVADIHFDYRAALASIEAGVDALRLNPGNIGGRDKVQAVARAARAKRVPIRVGVNAGSLEKGESVVSSALKHVKLLEDEDFHDIVISVKTSNVADTIAAYRELAEKTDCPLHVGLTEAGTFLHGTVHSSVAIGVLLAEGLGDTIRVSLTDTPEREVQVGAEILRALSLRAPGPNVTSCPTCGRTRCDVMGVAAEVERKLALLKLPPNRQWPHVAVMGCAVNGPGEAKGADIALCGGIGEFLLYRHGEIICKLPQADAADAVLTEVKKLLEER